jgi:hypothetical protein
VRAAQNQLLFRQVNERIRELGEKVLNTVAQMDFACECDDPTCTETIELPLEEFARIDSTPNRFIVLPGHVDEDVEDVVARNGGYLLVAKRGAGEEFVLRRGSAEP